MSKAIAKESLKKTGLVGGGQILNILFGLIKTKVAAIILGPAGIGLIGLFMNAMDTVRTIAGMGLSFSGVRDLAIANAEEGKSRVEQTVAVYIKWSLLFSFLGFILMMVFAETLGTYIFKNRSYTFEIRLLGTAVFINILSASFSAILQGLNEIGKMVKAGIYGNLLNTVIAVLLYYLFGEAAIVPVIITTATINLVCAFYFFRTLSITVLSWPTFRDSFPKVKLMIKIGFFTVVVAVFDQVVGLYLKSYLTEKGGMEVVGFFTTAFTIGSVYLSLVMGAVGTEYYPRLSAIQHDNEKINEALNVQLNIVLMLAVPLIISMIVFGKFVIILMYSKEFLEALPLLQYYLLGDICKIIAWPCGFIILAKGMGKVYIWSSIIYTVLYTGLIIFLYPVYGIKIIGISFLIMQFLSAVFYYLFVYINFRIKLNRANFRNALYAATAATFVLILSHFSDSVIKYVLIISVLLLVLFLSFYQLRQIIDFNSIKSKIWK